MRKKNIVLFIFCAVLITAGINRYIELWSSLIYSNNTKYEKDNKSSVPNEIKHDDLKVVEMSEIDKVAEENVTVTYATYLTNLEPGKEYKYIGTFKYKPVETFETELKVFTDEDFSSVISEKTFTAKQEKESLEIEFAIPASKLTNHNLMISEELYQESN